MTQRRKSDSTFYGVQALRAIAALMVVLDHCIYLWLTRVMHEPQANFWMNGAAGVDIFFVISGFVMTISLHGFSKYRHPVREFLRRRVTRIVPLYWIATTLKIVLLAIVPAVALHSALTPLNVAGSYLFVPALNAEHLIAPVIIVGWTLNFEMFFYVLFAAAMLFKERSTKVLIPTLCFLALIGIVYAPSRPAFLTLISPLLLEFMIGVLIGGAVISKRLSGRLISAVFLVVGFVSIVTVYPHLLYQAAHLKWRFLLWGLPAGLIVFGAVGLEGIFANALPKWLVSAGNASYAIYLVQTFVLPPIGIAVSKLGLHGRFALAVIVVSGLIFAAISGEIAHRFIELPILDFLKNKKAAGVRSLP